MTIVGGPEVHVIRVGEFEESIVIHFGTEGQRINAYTLATTLVNLADAARAANFAINPGYDIEVVVEALGGGSFKAKLRTIYRGAANLFTAQSLQALILSVIASFIYQHTLAPDTEVTVNVTAEEVVIAQGDKRIIVPRAVHEATKKAEARREFVSGVQEAVRAVESDTTVRTIGFSKDMDEPAQIEIPRERFALISAAPTIPLEDIRELLEEVDLEILRAILEKSRRRWEFVWNGTRISAPVLDDAFYADFFAHKITVAPGDILRAKLRVRQRRLPGVGVFVNDSFEVIEVLKHVQRAKQVPFAADTSVVDE